MPELVEGVHYYCSPSTRKARSGNKVLLPEPSRRHTIDNRMQFQFNQTKTTKLLALAVAILVIALISVLWGKYSSEEKYAAVTLNPGIIYFGKLSRFPSLTLSDVWMLNKDSEGRPSLEPLKNSPWSPDGVLHLNRKQLISWSYLSNDSQIVQAIRASQVSSPQSGVPGLGTPPQDQGPLGGMNQGMPGRGMATSTPPRLPR